MSFNTSKCTQNAFFLQRRNNSLRDSGSATATPVKRWAILHELAGETGQTCWKWPEMKGRGDTVALTDPSGAVPTADEQSPVA